MHSEGSTAGRRIRRSLLSTALVCAVFGTISFGAAARASAAPSTTPRLQMLALINRNRVDHGLDRLKLNGRLSVLATQHSREMAERAALSHTDNVPQQLQPWDWSAWGENVGMTNADLESLEWGFMNSADHRANILKPKFKHVGIGIVVVDGVYWVTVDFYG